MTEDLVGHYIYSKTRLKPVQKYSLLQAYYHSLLTCISVKGTENFIFFFYISDAISDFRCGMAYSQDRWCCFSIHLTVLELLLNGGLESHLNFVPDVFAAAFLLWESSD